MVSREKGIFSIESPFDEDPELIQKIRTDPTVFEQFYLTYRHKIFIILYGRVRDPQRAEELTHDCIIKIFLRVDNYQEKGVFTHWVIKIARNFSLNTARNTSRREAHEVKLNSGANVTDFLERLPDPHSLTMNDDIDEDEVTRDNLQRLSEIHTELTPKEKEILRLIYVQGKQTKQVAELWGQTDGAVKSFLNRTRDKIRTRWQHAFGTDNFRKDLIR